MVHEALPRARGGSDEEAGHDGSVEPGNAGGKREDAEEDPREAACDAGSPGATGRHSVRAEPPGRADQGHPGAYAFLENMT